MSIGERLRVRIEQALARGETFAYIAERQHVPLATVLAVQAALERINRERDEPAPKRGPRIPQPCGTRAAYERHRRKGEPVDDDCRRAKYEYSHQLSMAGLLGEER